MAKNPKQKQKCKLKGTWFLWLIAPFCVSVVVSIELSDRYTFLDGSPFLLPSLIVGLPLSVLCTVGAIRVGTVNKKFWPITGTLTVLLLLFCAMFLSFALNLNCLLDTSEPQKMTVMIEDKEIDFNRRARDDYELIFTYEGKEYSIEVPRSVYDRYEEGDLFGIQLRQGAFHRPFFIADLD